jgi:hypothetical protein
MLEFGWQLHSQMETCEIAEVKKILQKLLRDRKYEEFKDQIYYALANIAIGRK